MSKDPRHDPGTTQASIFLRLNTRDEGRREMSWHRFDRIYSPYVRGYASHLGVRGDALDEVVQSVLVGFFSVSPRFEYQPETKGRFRAYLAYAVRSAVYRSWRQQARGRPIEEYDAAAPEDDAARRVWERVALVRAIDEAQSSFEPKTFEAFELFCRRSVPAEQVGATLGISVDSVHQASSRVRRRVREILGRIMESDTLEVERS